MIIDDPAHPDAIQPAKQTQADADSNNWGLHIKNGVLDSCSIKESIVLTKKQIEKLTYLIYNTSHHKLPGSLEIVSPGGCFFPRNALLFLDKNGKIFDYLEICFECQNNHSHSKRITIGTFCTQKYDLLKKFFISAGIKYGTVGKYD